MRKKLINLFMMTCVIAGSFTQASFASTGKIKQSHTVCQP